MNIENLKIGYIYKNYKSLCDILDEPIKAGKSKQLQLKDWERYFNCTKNGNKFIITEIYDIPKEKKDNRNGGNNSSIISDIIHDYIVSSLELSSYCAIVGSKSGIIRQIGLVDSEFSNCYYNFDETFSHIVDGQSVQYTSIEKEFYFDYCDKVMNSYKNRLNRVLDNFGDAINIAKYYQTSTLKQSKYGNEFYTTEDIEDEETIDKINKIKGNLEFTYGVIENKDKWKIFSSRNRSKQFYDDFVGQVRTVLNDENIANCYEILSITRNENSEKEFEYKCDENYSEKLNKAQNKFANDKIESTFKVTKSIYDTCYMEYIKVPKYNREEISDDMINDCLDMVNKWIGMTIDTDTGEVLFSGDDIERLTSPTAEYHSEIVDDGSIETAS